MEKKVMIPYFIKGKNKFIGVINQDKLKDKNPDCYVSKDEYLICAIPKREESKSEFFKVIGDNECYLLKIKKKSVRLDNRIFVCKKNKNIKFFNLDKELQDFSELSIFIINIQIFFREKKKLSLWMKIHNFFHQV